jgi:hypothetical protein
MLSINRFSLTIVAGLLLAWNAACAQQLGGVPSVFVTSNASVATIAELFYADTAAIPLSKAMTIRGIAPQQQDNRCVMQDGTVQSRNSMAKKFGQ